MRLGVFSNGWWSAASAAIGAESIELPIAHAPDGNPHSADLESRITLGSTIVERLQREPVELLLDNSGAGLAFCRTPGADDNVQLAHEVARTLLCSHFIDPITTVFQGLNWEVSWAALRSPNWVKAVWDRAQVEELQRFGIPQVTHLRMAAPNRPYDATPVTPADALYAVSFVGGQNTSFFLANQSIPTGDLLPGVIAHAARADAHDVSFHDVFYSMYGLADPPRAEDDSAAAARKAAEYFRAKLYFHAALCVRNRDRYIVFLKQALGDAFRLIGTRWDEAYGLPCETPLPTVDAYLRHFRQAAINLNFVNGNAETGLNMRHFEITATGGFMLCPDQPELAECFDVGRECDVFRGEGELLDKIHYYLAHPEERCAIAAAGQRRTLSEHLYSHRLRQLLGQLDRPLQPAAFTTRSLDDDLRELMPDPDVILDCGANVGQMAVGLRRLYSGGTIYCFEPIAAAFAELSRRAESLRIIPVQKALGSHDGRARMHLTRGAEAHSLLDFEPGNPCAQWTEIVGREEVEVCTLDRWCREQNLPYSRISLLKLDVQGAELDALYGARELLRHVPLVYLEVSFVRLYRDAPLFPEIDRFLVECGFRRHALYPSDQPRLWGDALYVHRKVSSP